MVPLTVKNNLISREIFVLLDSGSTVSLINSEIIHELEIETSEVDVELRGIGDESVSVLANRKANLNVECDSFSGLISGVLVVKNLALPAQCVSHDLVDFCKQQTSIRTRPYFQAPDMILGQNHGNLIITHEFREVIKNSLYISRSLLGWSIHGSTTKGDMSEGGK